LSNPRYTGRQVWNKQRKEEVLLDVREVALGYETKMRWNDPRAWVWSDAIAHTPLVSTEDFEAAQIIRAGCGRGRKSRETGQRVIHPYVLRGLLYCGICGRRMQAQHNNQRTYYRCRYGKEYALASHVQHPVNVYVREEQLLPAVDRWLLKIFAPHRLERTVRELAAASCSQPAPLAPPDDSAAVIADCDAKLARYQATLDAGGDPVTIAAWTREATAQRAAALARQARPQTGTPLTEQGIQQIIQALGDIRDIIQNADPAAKARIYNRLELRLTYQPAQHCVHAQAILNPRERGDMGSVRGGT
jgi:site-specific DNA recombinase